VSSAVEDSFIGSGSTEMQAVARRIIDSIRKADKELDAAIKWNQLTFAKEGDFHHWICALRMSKRCVILTFHFGGLLEDKDGKLIAGTSRFARKMEFRTKTQVDQTGIVQFVAQAIDRLPYFIKNWQSIQAEYKNEKASRLKES